MKRTEQNQKSNIIRKYGDAKFLMCNSCFWCASYLGHNGNSFESCPTCRSDSMETLPVGRTEAYRVGIDGNSISMEFWNLRE